MSDSLVPVSAAIPAPSGDELLRKPTKRELSLALEKLFLAFFDPKRTDAAKIAALYAEVISQFSAWSIKEGIRRIISGEIRELNKNFLPSTAAVADVIRKVAETSPEAVERRWRNSLALWQSGRAWDPVWGIGPEDPGFEHECPPHLRQAFGNETMRRFGMRRH